MAEKQEMVSYLGIEYKLINCSLNRCALGIPIFDGNGKYVFSGDDYETYSIEEDMIDIEQFPIHVQYITNDGNKVMLVLKNSNKANEFPIEHNDEDSNLASNEDPEAKPLRKAERLKIAQEAVDLKEKLINEVQQMPCIWDNRRHDHRDRNLQEAKWTTISVVLDIPVEECKRKWKNLKDSFRTNFSAATKGKSGDALEEALGNVAWVFFKPMLFLRDLYIPRKQSSNIELKKSTELAKSDDIHQYLSEDENFEDDIPLPDEPCTSGSRPSSSSNKGTSRPNSAQLRPSSAQSRPISAQSRPTSAQSSRSASEISNKPLCQKSKKSKLAPEVDDDSETIILQELNKLQEDLRVESGKQSNFACYLTDLLNQLSLSERNQAECEILQIAYGYVNKTKKQ